MKPFLIIAFLNAFTDVGHKIVLHNAIYKYYSGGAQMALTAIVNGLILLPFVLTFSPAGYLSDKYSKKKIIQISAFCSIPVTLLITFTYGLGLFWVSFAATFVLALQSAFYGPAKYGYIQELLEKKNLSKGIGALQSVTIVAILLSSVIYSAGFEKLHTGGAIPPGLALKAMVPLGIIMIITCLVEWALSFQIKSTGIFKKTLPFKISTYFRGGYLKANLQDIISSKPILVCMLGLSVFWAVNQVILASFPAFFKETTKIDNVLIAQGIAALAGVGIIIGCLWSSQYPQARSMGKLIIYSGIGMALCLLTLPQLESPLFLALLIFIYGFFGGSYLVPLNTILQLNAPPHSLGRTLAGKNFLQNLLMLVFLGGSVTFAMLNIPLSIIFILLFFILSLTLGLLVFWRKHFTLPGIK